MIPRHVRPVLSRWAVLCLLVLVCWGGMTVWVFAFHHHHHCDGHEEQCPYRTLLLNLFSLPLFEALTPFFFHHPTVPVCQTRPVEMRLARRGRVRAPPLFSC
ncbi:MAG: hypothetical protein GX580_11955 [Candidatus Hydrogenedens sp.]|nr:hypothetical protein [Candidatus Hydrogenedens sp.]